jgi:glycosyltransferase involved in cell wall biosynthesis
VLHLQYMIIGLEAKRIFQNSTGLGNATRSIIAALATYYPMHQYHLFAPKRSFLFDALQYKNLQVHTPNTLIGKLLKPYWRSKGVVAQLQQNQIELFIGLAGELPIGLATKNIKSIVFVHDIIFERYPKQYNPIDVITYRKKTKYACLHANAVLVNSAQTKNDLINFYHIPSSKIHVVFLSCEAQYAVQKSKQEIEIIKQKYSLPPAYFLSVGSIIERKGLLKICEAMQLLGKAALPLVVIGNGQNDYANSITAFIAKYNLQSKIIFLNQHTAAQQVAYKSSADFPAIYQGAKALIYPSVFEGFGLPILEGMTSGVPIITSNCSCMPEVGGDAVLYVNPLDANNIASAMQLLITDKNVCASLQAKGKVQAAKFSEKILAERIIEVVKALG